MKGIRTVTGCGDLRCSGECDSCLEAQRRQNVYPAVVRLVPFLRACSRDEIRVVEHLVDRFMGQGRLGYGPLNIAADQRNFDAEGRDELLDAVFYFAAEVERQRRELIWMRLREPGTAGPFRRAWNWCNAVWQRFVWRLPG